MGIYSAPGVWTSFSPTWSGITPGNGTTSAFYTQIGQLVSVWFCFTAGTTSSGTGVSPALTPPVNANGNYGTLTAIGNWRYGASNALSGYCRLDNATKITLVSLAVSGTTIIDANLPVALSTGFTIFGSFTYQSV